MMSYREEKLYSHCCIIGILFIICAVIGLPSVIYGCDTYYIDCLKYTYAQKTVMRIYDTSLDGFKCLSWTNTDKIGTCNTYGQSTKYGAEIQFDTCSYYINTPFYTQKNAIDNALYYYPIGSTIKMAVSKDNPKKCEYPGGLPKNLAIVGILFSSLAGIFAIIIIIDIIMICLTKEEVRVAQTPNNTSQAIAV